MISIIKVGYLSKSLNVTSQNSKICTEVLSVLYKLGYIRGYTIIDKKSIKILLKYHNNKPVIRGINVVSTPGRRFYITCNDLKKRINKSDLGHCIISTSKGFLTDQEAVMYNVGGEVFVKVF